MKEPKIDYQRLSALLEGRVSDREREELLAQLAASTDDFEAYTDTVEILMAVEEEDALSAPAAEKGTPAAEAVPEGVTPLRRPDRGRRRMGRNWLMAASIAAIALVSTFTLRGRGYAGAHPVELAELADPTGAPLPEGLDAPGPRLRGEPGSSARDVDAVRAGATLVDLAVAVRASDTPEIMRLAKRLSTAYRPGESADEPLQRIVARPETSRDSLNVLVDLATDQLAGTLDRSSLEVGLWLQSARLAAYHKNGDFFRARATDTILRRAERLARGNAHAGAAVDSVNAALPGNGQHEWSALRAHLDLLLNELAS